MADERRTFHQELDEICADLVRLAAMAGEMITRATDALLDADMLMAQAIIDHDDDVDVLSRAIEDRCVCLLALQSPMAADLRTITATMWINGDLERSADLGVNIVKGARRLYGSELPPRLRGLITAMDAEAVRLLRLSVDAYVERDGPLGGALHDIDDRLDQLHTEFVEEMLRSQQGGQALALQPAVQLALIARYYERIGDHAVNIGERVAFMVLGEQPEHPGVERIRRRRGGTGGGDGNGAGDGSRDAGAPPD